MSELLNELISELQYMLIEGETEDSKAEIKERLIQLIAKIVSQQVKIGVHNTDMDGKYSIDITAPSGMFPEYFWDQIRAMGIRATRVGEKKNEN
jgi:hypothetical protein